MLRYNAATVLISLQSVQYLHKIIPSEWHKHWSRSGEGMSKTPNLPIAGDALNLSVNEADSNGFQRPNPKGMTSRMSQERIDVL